MKNLPYLLLFACLCWLVSCKDTPSPTEVIGGLIGQKSDTCQLSMTGVLPGNRYTDFTAREKVVLRDPGQSNWRLEVYDLYDCSMKAAYQLPPNGNSDYPYFLADLNYNNTNRKIGIRGDQAIFLVNLESQEMSKAIIPQFPEGERLVDTESGSIRHLEVWENYLIGQTVDWGAFVFRVDSIVPKAITPVAELKDEGEYRSLFLIETGNGNYQAILPRYNFTSGLFSINPLFNKPKALLPAATVYAGGPYVRVKEPSGELIGINLHTGKLLPVIEEKKVNQ